MLTYEQILEFQRTQVGEVCAEYPLENSDWVNFARAIEAAACAERDARIAHLEATSSANYKRGHDDAHSMLSERIAGLEARNRDLYEDVQRFKDHALNEKAARLELERQLEEARKDAERYRWLRSVPNGFKAQRIVNDTPHGMDAAIDAAMKGTP